MNVTARLVVSTACLWIGAGCAGRQVAPTTATSSQSASGTGSSAPAEAADDPVAAMHDTDCVSKSECDKVELEIKLVDLRTGGTVDELKGFSNSEITWGLKVEPESSTSTRRILLRVENAPETLEVSKKANTAVIMGFHDEATSGTFDVTYRDVDYCKVRHKDDDDCEDISVAMDDFDESASVSYRILESTQDRAQAEQEKKMLAAQSTAQKQQCLGGLFAVLTGNIGGAAGCVGMVVK